MAVQSMRCVSVEAEDTPVRALNPDNEMAYSGAEMKSAVLSAWSHAVDKEAEMLSAHLWADVPRDRSCQWMERRYHSDLPRLRG